MRLVAIGLVAGVFSSLFGVGGGIVIVPLLILAWRLRREGGDGDVARCDCDHGARRRGAVLAGGKVDFAYAALVGVPAMAGALGGTACSSASRAAP